MKKTTIITQQEQKEQQDQKRYLEKYKIVFEGLDQPLFEVKDETSGQYIPKYTLDSDTNTNIGNSNESKKAFLSGILYRDFNNDILKKGRDFYTPTQQDFEREFYVNIKNYSSLYNQLQGKTITEYLGVYYIEETPNKAEVNLQKKRVITYKVEQQFFQLKKISNNVIIYM